MLGLDVAVSDMILLALNFLRRGVFPLRVSPGHFFLQLWSFLPYCFRISYLIARVFGVCPIVIPAVIMLHFVRLIHMGQFLVCPYLLHLDLRAVVYSNFLVLCNKIEKLMGNYFGAMIVLSSFYDVFFPIVD